MIRGPPNKGQILIVLICYETETGDRPVGADSLGGVIREAAIATLQVTPSMWFAQTDDDVGAWGQKLTPHMATTDRLVIANVTSSASVNGWLTPASWSWIRERTP
jgi:hypothetical protein